MLAWFYWARRGSRRFAFVASLLMRGGNFFSGGLLDRILGVWLLAFWCFGLGCLGFRVVGRDFVGAGFG